MANDLSKFSIKNFHRQANLNDSGRQVLHELSINVGIQDITERVHYRAVKNWLGKYKPEAKASNLEQVRGYVEAFHHLCEIKEWQKAGIVLSASINTTIGTDYALYRQLEIWGYYNEQLEIYKRLLSHENIPPNLCVVALVGLGNVYGRLASYSKAIDYSQKALERSRETVNCQSEATALSNLGIGYAGLNQWKKAIDCFQESSEVAQNTNLIPERAGALGNLGNVCGSRGKFRQAIDYLEQCLVLARQMQDRVLEMQALGNLGNAYGYLKNYEQAATYLEQYLTTAQVLENSSGKVVALNSLGELYRQTKQYDRAVNCLQESLSLSRETREPLSEKIFLGNLGSVYGNMGSYEKAIEYHQQALALARRIGDRQGIFLGHLNLLLAHLFFRFSTTWHTWYGGGE